jgi:hypothetical protein
LQKIAEKNHVQLLWLQRLSFSGYWVPILVVMYFTFSLLHPSHMISQILHMSLWLFIDGFFMASSLVPICFKELQGLSVY